MSQSGHERFFNTAGYVDCNDHYCLPPLTRFNLEEIISLISQKKYFILHAPRQTGKTSCLLALMKYLNTNGEYWAVYTNFEMGQAARGDVQGAMKALVSDLLNRTRIYTTFCIPDDIIENIWQKEGPFGALGAILSEISGRLDRPFVLLIDEIDALMGDTLISVLRQIRSKYDLRPSAFPSSIILCGLRDLRDYRIHSDLEKAIITGGSAFNIKAKSLILGNFSEEEVRTLCLQHTEETGQIFEESALFSIWHYSQGQPWLINALAYETCFEMDEGKDQNLPITEEMVIQAKENLIIRRETHIDQLTDKLREPRVHRIIAPMLEGESLGTDVSDDDIEYLIDLGLITKRSDGLEVSNPIYQEVIPRALISVTYENVLTLQDRDMPVKASSYILKNGRIDLKTFLIKFQQFFRENSEAWIGMIPYREAAPQLLLQAFFQGIVNGGGRVEREYGLGRKRTDILIIWPVQNGKIQRIVIEIKILRLSLKKTIQEGLAQTYSYVDRCGADEAYLIIVDQSRKKPWSKKIYIREEVYQGTEEHKVHCPITVMGI